jgi:hypothetical protein
MSTALSETFSSFSEDVVHVLKTNGFFKGNPTAVQLKTWRQLHAISEVKNQNAFNQMFNQFSKPSLEKGVNRVAEMLDVDRPNPAEVLQMATEYLKDRRAEVTAQLTGSDMNRLRAMLEPESLKARSGMLLEDGSINFDAFKSFLEDSYICDNNGSRSRACDLNESHFAEGSGASQMADDAGADEKFRQTKGDDKVRDEHRWDSEAGWIPKDDPYPYSREMESGDDSFGCRCQDLYRISNNE